MSGVDGDYAHFLLVVSFPSNPVCPHPPPDPSPASPGHPPGNPLLSPSFEVILSAHNTYTCMCMHDTDTVIPSIRTQVISASLIVREMHAKTTRRDTSPPLKSLLSKKNRKRHVLARTWRGRTLSPAGGVKWCHHRNGAKGPQRTQQPPCDPAAPLLGHLSKRIERGPNRSPALPCPRTAHNGLSAGSTAA